MKLITSTGPISRNLRLQSFDAVVAELEKLQKAQQVLLSPGWNLPHTLDHCARSIEHAMKGFPELNSPVFRAIVGPIAFHVFDLRGQMSHELTKEIPGDTEPPGDLTPETALAHLQESIRTFEAWQGAMQSHYAYGRLTKSQYERANAMHIANHLAAMEY
jgi:hypothetical protein